MTYYDEKRAKVTANLLFTMYDEQIDEAFLSSNGIFMTFKNKPDQPVKALFALFDTWDKIKKKTEKLAESDGICVVCCEPEIYPLEKKLCVLPDGEKKHIYKRKDVEMCNHCCEFICRPCTRKFIETSREHRCPVCRMCILAYKLKMEGKSSCPYSGGCDE